MCVCIMVKHREDWRYQYNIITCLVLTNNGENKMPQTDDLKDQMTTVNPVVQDWFTPPSALW